MNDSNRSRVTTGGILIVLGLGLFALQFIEGLGSAVILFLIGGVFVAVYLFNRAYGFLIPGGILLGLGLGQVGEQTGGFLAFAGFGSVGLGIGFVSIYVIDLVYRGATSWWPLIPGGILIVSGLGTTNDAVRRLFSVGWPLILVFIGLIVLAGAFGIGGRGAVANAHSDLIDDLPDPLGDKDSENI